mgnify:CR=1 FL=1
MCNHEDDLKCITYYKPKLDWFDKLVMGLVLCILIVCLSFIIYGVFNPIYLVC